VTDTYRPLPAAVSEFMTDRHGATPTEALELVERDEQFRKQGEHYCAVTRFTVFGVDVAEWDVPESVKHE
jgi:hypothetical protein